MTVVSTQTTWRSYSTLTRPIPGSARSFKALLGQAGAAAKYLASLDIEALTTRRRWALRLKWPFGAPQPIPYSFDELNRKTVTHPSNEWTSREMHGWTRLNAGSVDVAERDSFAECLDRAVRVRPGTGNRGYEGLKAIAERRGRSDEALRYSSLAVTTTASTMSIASFESSHIRAMSQALAQDGDFREAEVLLRATCSRSLAWRSWKGVSSARIARCFGAWQMTGKVRSATWKNETKLVDELPRFVQGVANTGLLHAQAKLFPRDRPCDESFATVVERTSSKQRIACTNFGRSVPVAGRGQVKIQPRRAK